VLDHPLDDLIPVAVKLTGTEMAMCIDIIHQ
jgi:hypothetical protein